MSDLHKPSAGYRGFLSVGGNVWPYSSSTIAENVDIIRPSVNGYAGQVGIVMGAKSREGSVTLPILGTSMLVDLLGYFISESARTTMRSIILDNTFIRQTFQGFLKSIDIKASPGAGVEATIELTGGIVDESSSAPVTYADTTNGDHANWTPDTTFITSYGGAAQIPFWRTKVTSSTGGLAAAGAYWKEVSGWSFKLDNNTGTTLVTAADSNDPQGYKLHQGQQTGEGQLTLINPFVSSSFSHLPDWTDLIFTLTDADGTNGVNINLGKVVNYQYGPQLPEPNTRITQSISYAITVGASSTINNILFSIT